MQADIEIVGVHPVKTEDVCHLIEIAISKNIGILDFDETFGCEEELKKKHKKVFDICEVTQEDKKLTKDDWQVPYEEQLLKTTEDRVHYVFFFHFLDLSKPLLTSLGPQIVPKPTPMPNHLKHIEYEPVD